MENYIYESYKVLEGFENKIGKELHESISGSNLSIKFIPSRNRFIEITELNISGILYKRINKL